MRYQSQETRVRKVLFTRIFMVILVILVVLLGRGVFNVYQMERESRERKGTAEKNLADLKSREALLEKNIAALNTPEGVEAALRSQFDVAKEGEGLIVVVEESLPSEAPAPRSLWERLWGYVAH